MIAKYDESELVAELKHLPVAFRAIFATACAERPVPAYRLLINYTELRSNRVLRKGIKPFGRTVRQGPDFTAPGPERKDINNDMRIIFLYHFAADGVEVGTAPTSESPPASRDYRPRLITQSPRI